MMITSGPHHLEIAVTPIHALIGPDDWVLRMAARAIVPITSGAYYSSLLADALVAMLSAPPKPTYLVLEKFGAEIYPTKVREVMRILRAESSKVPILISTNNPLVINEMQPEEVTLLAQDADRRIHARRFDKTKNFAERSKVYALGELWLAFADGKHETELLGEDTR